jgi:hypothetical protein
MCIGGGVYVSCRPANRADMATGDCIAAAVKSMVDRASQLGDESYRVGRNTTDIEKQGQCKLRHSLRMNEPRKPRSGVVEGGCGGMASPQIIWKGDGIPPNNQVSRGML